MKEHFPRPNSGGPLGAAQGEARLTLAAFGKHPGWDDHIPGIGVETDALAFVKQSFYVGGIGSQIDSGSWEKLEPEKRLEGFDHTFLWLRPGHVLLGQLWSSTDRKGRAKYPMVLCVDGEGVSPSFLAGRLQPDLERLRNACRAAVSPEQVVAECRATQERLNVFLGDPGRQAPGPMAQPEFRRRFLERWELGPDRQGLLRVLHELDSAPGLAAGSTTRAATRSVHLRLPVASDSPTEALLLWADFLLSAVSTSPPLLLIARGGEPWLDVILGEPANGDWFCLQASPRALPLATEIPYELLPAARQRLAGVESRFLDLAGRTPAERGRAASPPGTSGQPELETAASRGGQGKWVIAIAGAVLILAAVVWLLGNRGSMPEVKPPPETKARPPQPQAERPANPEEDYRRALESGRTAYERKDYATAIQQAGRALEIKTNDAAAASLKEEAAARQRELAMQAQQDVIYRQAMAAGQAALDRNDFAEAIRQADMALMNRKDDPEAARLKSSAQARLQQITQAGRDKKYTQAMDAARAAWEWKDYAEANRQLDVALENRKDDPEAVKLKTEAQARLQEQTAKLEQEKRYPQAMAAAQAALERKDVAEADQRADEALMSRKDDPAALELKSRIKSLQREIAAQAERDRIGAAETAKLDAELEKMLVRFAVLDPKDATTPEGQAARKLTVEIGVLRDHYLKITEGLEQEYATKGLLNADREQNLKQLKENIKNHP